MRELFPFPRQGSNGFAAVATDVIPIAVHDVPMTPSFTQESLLGVSPKGVAAEPWVVGREGNITGRDYSATTYAETELQTSGVELQQHRHNSRVGLGLSLEGSKILGRHLKGFKSEGRESFCAELNGQQLRDEIQPIGPLGDRADLGSDPQHRKDSLEPPETLLNARMRSSLTEIPPKVTNPSALVFPVLGNSSRQISRNRWSRSNSKNIAVGSRVVSCVERSSKIRYNGIMWKSKPFSLQLSSVM